MSHRPPWSDPPCYPTERFVVQEGCWIETEPLVFGRARLNHTDGQIIDTFWELPSMDAALAALSDFLADHEALEPEGWNRSNNGATYRRRPNLRRDEEYVTE